MPTCLYFSRSPRMTSCLKFAKNSLSPLGLVKPNYIVIWGSRRPLEFMIDSNKIWELSSSLKSYYWGRHSCLLLFAGASLTISQLNNYSQNHVWKDYASKHCPFRHLLPNPPNISINVQDSPYLPLILFCFLLPHSPQRTFYTWLSCTVTGTPLIHFCSSDNWAYFFCFWKEGFISWGMMFFRLLLISWENLR